MVPVAGGALLVVVLALVGFLAFGGDDGKGDGQGGGDESSAASDTAARPDPDKDPEAWKQLSPEDRAARVTEFSRTVNVRLRDAVEPAIRFLRARDEEDAAQALAMRYLERDTDAQWARDVVGHVDVRKRVERCLDRNPQAYEVDAEPVIALDRLMEKQKPGPWWVDADALAEVDALIAEVKATEELLADPYHKGVARWIQYQRRIDVMREMPSIAKATGPYVVFAQVKAEPGTLIRDVDPDALAEAHKVLDAHAELFADYYDGFLEHFGPLLDLERYGPENATFDTLLKANVFPDREMYDQFNVSRGMGRMPFVRAYYSPQEPRFICTYVTGDVHGEQHTNQVQCHELTHQIVHFYTWLKATKKTGKPVRWLDVSIRPAWSEEGFAEFFSSFRVENGKRVWMQPLLDRLRSTHQIQRVLKFKGWKNLSIEEMLVARTTDEIGEIGRSRARSAEDQELAGPMYTGLFYGRAWSLVHFMWFHEEDGKPKYRDRFIDYLRFEFDVQWDRVAIVGQTGKTRLIPHEVNRADFRRVMGLEADGALKAFGAEWEAYLDALIEKHKSKWKRPR